MLGRLFKWLFVALLLVATVWTFRDTEPVRQRRALIESTLNYVGMSEASVRHYWPLEEPGGRPAPSSSASNASDDGAKPSLWNDFVKRYNPITLLSDRIYATDQVKRQSEDAQKRAISP